MRFLHGLTAFLYMTVFFALGTLFIVLALNIVPQDTVVNVMTRTYYDHDVQIIFFVVGVLMIVINLLVFQLMAVKIQREKTIAFDNPDGRVTIALAAIEDFIKRSVRQLPEVKELRPDVRAGKKGITIVSRVTLYPDINIPEVVGKIQGLIKAKVQDMIGFEEPISVPIHIGKIVFPDKHEATPDAKKDDRSGQFRGSIEYGGF